MKQYIAKWKKMSTFERTMSAIGLACSVAIVVLGVLYLLDIATFGIVVAIPLLGVALLAQCGMFWKKDRTMAIFSAVAGLSILGMTFYALFR